ncbi:hypothetical protein [Marinoscillum furvescens]|uniref:Uncharacterized protein n=1 Tax=Marinoscillum furvescens DSM 4134 TaxID=1122208 RepID=A0A3D9L5E9_MARFU|nr:hypothetical protein [Marinoscillum furvescens]REE01139.1 hypothetical protein C7460_104159 [Marinoscillum furvescens DSM 4134]
MAKESHKPTNRWFKSERVTFGTSNIDAENGVLSGVIMCQVGEALGHGVHLEQSFIEDGIKKANENFKKKGMKARFGHPSMSNETLGSEMGRFKNFRVEDDKMVADLHLFDSANLSPTHPGMKDWMISQASEDPEAIMCSIVFKPLYEYQYDEDNKRVNIWYCDKKGIWNRCRNQNGEMTHYDPKKDLFVEMDDIYFCDIVDQGAATDKLFSANFNSDKFSVIATEFLNDNPNIDDFIRDNPEKLFEFLHSRHAEVFAPSQEMSEGHTGLLNSIKKFFSKKSSTNSPNQETKKETMNFQRSLEILGKETPSAEELAEVKSEIQQFTGANEKFTKEELDQHVEDAKSAAENAKQSELDQANTEIQSLKDKVQELESASADPENPENPSGKEELETANQPEVPYSVKTANEHLGD